VGFIETDVFIILETIRQSAAMLDSSEQRLDIDALKGWTGGGEEVDSGGKQVAGTENIALRQVVTSRRQFHQAMEKFGSLPRFEGDEPLKVVMALQKFAAVEELNPPL
jgi:hypothetical protein